MKHRLQLLAVILCGLLGSGLAFASTPPKHYARTIYIVNHSSVVTDRELKDDLPAFQAAVSKDFAPVWDVDVQLVIVKKAPPGSWRIIISDNSPFLGALGYHDLSAQGIPVGYVFAMDAQTWGSSWTIIFTHELFELLADPYINRSVLVGNTFYLMEDCDPVEGDQFAYTRRAASGKLVKISDFITPRWYLPELSSGRFDFTGHVQRPLQILPDGYVATWTPLGWAITQWPATVPERNE